MTTSTLTLSMATLVCCALAEHGNPLAGGDMDRDYAHRIVRHAHTVHTPEEMTRWRERVHPSEWSHRWAWARKVAQGWSDMYPEVRHLPHAHEQAGLPGDT